MRGFGPGESRGGVKRRRDEGNHRSGILVLAAAWVLFSAAIPGVAAGTDNARTTLVLHAIPHDDQNDCFTPEDAGFDCTPDGPANVIIGAFSQVDIYLYVRNYDSLVGVQCAFSWPVEWQLQRWGPDISNGCQSAQVYGVVPQQHGGPTSGTVTTAFDCLTGGALAAIGNLSFVAGISGCLEIVESSYPVGTHVVGCDAQSTAVDPAGWGRVCVDQGGVDSCEPLDPVTASTWGRIKAGYRD